MAKSKLMIKFSSSFKLNEIHIVDRPFNEDPKNLIFFQGGPNFGEGQPENLLKMGNSRDIFCYANQPLHPGTKILVMAQFPRCQTNF